MEYIYVCCAYDGSDEKYIKALNYSRYVKSKGKVPLCPVTMLHGIYDSNKPEEQSVIKKTGKSLLKLCDEVWVFGANDIESGKSSCSGGKPIRYIKDDFRFNDKTEMLSILVNTFQSKTGRLINRWIMENMVFYLDKGLSDKLIVAAIEKAALKSAGWDYVEGILKRCLENGTTTFEDMENHEIAIKNRENHAAYNLDWYEQILNRDY